MKTRDPNLRWTAAQVRQFSKQAVDRFGRDFWRHVSTDVREAACDAVAMSVLTACCDSQFTEIEVNALRVAIWRAAGLLDAR